MSERNLELGVVRSRVVREEGQVVPVFGGCQERVLGAALVVVGVCDAQTGIPGELAARIAVEQLAKPGAGRFPVTVLEALLPERQKPPIGLRPGGISPSGPELQERPARTTAPARARVRKVRRAEPAGSGNMQESGKAAAHEMLAPSG